MRGFSCYLPAARRFHTQIGRLSFCVDLAVVHPDARGTYLAGVECDGPTYHRSASTAQDMRRVHVLRGSGWDELPGFSETLISTKKAAARRGAMRKSQFT
ncbi:hypothetical protein [Caldimonas brevitalea]|uniref:hypothetical protein n=1 Tax=Caldimonas brevitalea TaxID=413882 RepID=UPI003AA9B112